MTIDASNFCPLNFLELIFVIAAFAASSEVNLIIMTPFDRRVYLTYSIFSIHIKNAFNSYMISSSVIPEILISFYFMLWLGSIELCDQIDSVGVKGFSSSLSTLEGVAHKSCENFGS